MSTAASNPTAHRAPGARTLAQTTALVLGATLVLAGILGFIAEAGFGTGDSLDRGDLIVFDVNGWHNLVHIASGLFLLAMSGKARSAATGLVAFGVIYAVVTVWGLIDGEEILGLLPVDAADNVLHIGLTLVALAVGLGAGKEMADRRTT